MQPRIENLQEKFLIGKQLTLSFSDNKTADLWRGFMPRRNEIQNSLGSELYSVEVYSPDFFDSFHPEKPFCKWAAIEVKTMGTIPQGMEALTIPAGLYAVFIHKGPASDGEKTYRYIFETWLPHSGYQLENRPHFAVMGEKYKNDSQDSEEEIWIPVGLSFSNRI